MLIKNINWIFTENLIVPPKEEWMKVGYIKLDKYNEYEEGKYIVDIFLGMEKITPQSLEVYNPTPFDLNILLSRTLRKNLVIPSFSVVGVNIPSEYQKIYMEITFTYPKVILLKPIEIYINNFPIPSYSINYGNTKKWYKKYELSNGNIRFDTKDYVKEVDISLVGGGASISFVDYAGNTGDYITLAGDMIYNFFVSVSEINVNLEENAQGEVVVWY
ncbi:MAG: hypothetical protein NZ841_08425 [Dictyoglomus sp.]|nr:hypothetical protein [Dictyoglomus sp.]MDW8189308.1 hypothetical protein [Dictyoglomus sp.]